MSMLCRFLVVCVLTIGICATEEIENKDKVEIPKDESHTHNLPRVFEDQIKKVVECFRQQLLKGIPKLNIKTLDPLYLPVIPLIINTRLLRSTMLLPKFQLDGMAGFELTEGSLNPGVFPTRGILDLGLKFETLRVTSNYRGKMNLFDMIDVFGKGSLRVEFANFEIDIRVEVAPIPLEILGFSLKLSLPRTQANITGLFNDEYMSKIISMQLSDTLTTLAEEEETKVNEFIDAFILSVIPQINEMLKNLTIEDIIAIIVGGNGNCEPALFTIIQAVIAMLMNIIGADGDFVNLENYVDNVLQMDNFDNKE